MAFVVAVTAVVELSRGYDYVHFAEAEVQIFHNEPLILLLEVESLVYFVEIVTKKPANLVWYLVESEVYHLLLTIHYY